jgi:hypothetical protein
MWRWSKRDRLAAPVRIGDAFLRNCSSATPTRPKWRAMRSDLDQASVLLHAVLPIMKWRNDIHSLADLIYVHPSLAEVVRGAARKVAGMLPASCRDMEPA